MLEDYTIDIKNKWYDLQDKELQIRVENADKILGNDIHSKIMLANKISQGEREKSSFIAGLRLGEYQRLLNPEGQDKMMTLKEFCNNNSNIPRKIIFKKLVGLKYAHKYNINLHGERGYWFAQQKPYTYLSIIPIYYPDRNSILFNQDLVICDKTVKILQEECEQEYKRQIEEQAKKALEQEQKRIEYEKRNYLF